MLNNYFTIKAGAEYLNKEIHNFLIKEIYTQEKNKLLIEVSKDDTIDSKVLEFSIERNYNYLLIKNNFSKAKKNYVNLFEEVYGKKILKSELYNDDRVISYKLEDGWELIFVFFSDEANCFVVRDTIVINAFKNRNLFQTLNISSVIPLKKNSPSDLSQNITAEDYLKEFYPQFGKLYKKEILFRTNTEGREMISGSVKKTVDEEAKVISKELISPEYFLFRSDDELFISLIELKHIKSKFEKHENINNLISEFIKLKQRHEGINAIRKKKVKEFESRIENMTKKIRGLETQIHHSENSQNFRIYGEMILQNINSIKRVM